MTVTLKKRLGDGGTLLDRSEADNIYDIVKALIDQVASLRGTVAALRTDVSNLRGTVAALQTDQAALKTAVGATIATADAAGTVDGTWGNGAGEEGPALTGVVSLANTAKARINALAAVTLTAAAPAALTSAAPVAMGVVVE